MVRKTNPGIMNLLTKISFCLVLAGTFSQGFGQGQVQMWSVRIPSNLTPFFQSGMMNFLNPTRYQLLQGGRWNLDGFWETVDGKQIRPNTSDWTKYFGNTSVNNLQVLFSNGESFQQLFGWIPSNFFEQWLGWKDYEGPQTVIMYGNRVPIRLALLFENGLLSWLNSARYNLLQGGTWNTAGYWVTGGGKIIKPGSSDWKVYFGGANPSDISQIFPNGASWTDVFGWMEPGFWLNWPDIQPPEPQPTYVLIDGGVSVPENVAQYFITGKLYWLNPTSYTLLQGGRWNPAGYWETYNQKQIRPGTSEWKQLFGSATQYDISQVFLNGEYFSDLFGWIPQDFFLHWHGDQKPTPGGVDVGGGVSVPSTLASFFIGGRLDWLNPTRWSLLQGGRWNPAGWWETAAGKQIRPGTSDWTTLFGNANSSDLGQIFQGGASWDDIFGWLTANFFQTWQRWQQTGIEGGVSVPSSLASWFNSRKLDWLNPTRWSYLQGGRWNPAGWWESSDGKQVRPGTSDWTTLFGNANQFDIGQIFQGGASWDDIFGWLNSYPNFFQKWPGWHRQPEVQQVTLPGGASVPANLAPFFLNGKMDWLNPTRWSYLQGGRWNPAGWWETADGKQVRPGTQEWSTLFGSANPNDVKALFPNGESWEDIFGWLTPGFFQKWLDWQKKQIQWVPLSNGGSAPDNLAPFFEAGKLNWLNPTRWSQLQGGRWNPAGWWETADGRQIRPGTPEWVDLFGNTHPDDIRKLFPFGESWSDIFGWMKPDFFQNWRGWRQQPTQPPIQWVPLSNGGSVPAPFAPVFESGKMDWLNPTRWSQLQGGRWNPAGWWETAGGRQIRPGTPEWADLFGNAHPDDIRKLFPNGEGWNDIFGWMKPDFFQQWKGWIPKPTVAPIQWVPLSKGGSVPAPFAPVFESGKMDWLNPTRWSQLQGGRWNPAGWWETSDGRQIRPGTPEWADLFGGAHPDDIRKLFPNGESWSDIFGWIKPDFFQQWTGWRTVPTTTTTPKPTFGQIKIPLVTNLGPEAKQLFASGKMAWLTPQRIQMLAGGRWDPIKSRWYTRNGVPVTPGTAQWTQLFGDFPASSMRALFPYGGTWDNKLYWLNDIVKQLPPEALAGGTFDWSQLFSGQTGKK